MERAIAVRRQGAKSCPRYRSAVAKWTRKLGSTFVNPVTGKSTLIRTPKGTIPEDKLVRAVNKSVTVLPNGGLRFDSKPVQAVLEPYSEQLEQAAEIERQREAVNWRRWEELGLTDNGWIKFRRTLRRVLSNITSVSS